MSAPRGLAPVRTVLGSGAVLTAKAAHAIPAVTIHAAIQAGSVFDPPVHAGLANLVAQTMDRGTATRTSDEIAIDLDNRGASLKVGLNRHIISVSCTCLTEDFADMLALVGDVVMNPSFPPDQVALRRGEIITGIRQDEDNPAAMAGEALLRLLYPGHPYAQRPAGSVESIETMPPAALRGFHETLFAPASLSVVIVGDVAEAQAIEAATRVFGGWDVAAPHAMPLPPVAPATTRQRLVLPMMNKSQADIAYGFATILRSDPAYYAYYLLNTILGQYSMGGRLGDRIREREGMAYYCFSSLDANVVPGPLVVRAGVNPTNVDKAVLAIDEELHRMAADGPTAKELDESKRYVIGAMPRTLETNAGIATFLQTSEFFCLGTDHDLELPALLHSVTLEQVHAAAAATLVPERAAVVIAGPYDDRG